jgi:hypothetical protein
LCLRLRQRSLSLLLRHRRVPIRRPRHDRPSYRRLPTLAPAPTARPFGIELLRRNRKGEGTFQRTRRGESVAMCRYRMSLIRRGRWARRLRRGVQRGLWMCLVRARVYPPRRLREDKTIIRNRDIVTLDPRVCIQFIRHPIHRIRSPRHRLSSRPIQLLTQDSIHRWGRCLSTLNSATSCLRPNKSPSILNSRGQSPPPPHSPRNYSPDNSPSQHNMPRKRAPILNSSVSRATNPSRHRR